MGPSPTGRGGKVGRRNNQDNKSIKNSKNPKDKKDGNCRKKLQQLNPESKKRPSSEELSKHFPIPLQQLLLNVFRSALFFTNLRDDHLRDGEDNEKTPEQQPLAIAPLIQTLKTHLYNRDFISAFADAEESLLRAYALRWSAGRALGYVGVLDGIWRNWVASRNDGKSPGSSGKEEVRKKAKRHVVCIGGGAGAEIVALAGVWRMLRDEAAPTERPTSARGDTTGASSLGEEVSRLSLRDDVDGEDEGARLQENTLLLAGSNAVQGLPELFITAVDIADWSPVVDRLSKAIKSPSVPSSKTCRAPLLSPSNTDSGPGDCGFDVSFRHLDILNLPDEKLRFLLCPVPSDISDGQENRASTSPARTSTDLVTLMFTLNELFSTSIPKTTSFLLRMTDLLEPGAVLLVVDSPGSYSTVALGKSAGGGDAPSEPSSGDVDSAAAAASSQQQKPRSYPMRFLLDHTLLTVAAGCWECVLLDESRWFRREASRLSYDVGEGIGLEDMRFQVHVYRRLKD